MAMRRQTGAPMLVALVATVAILGAAFGALPVADARRIIVPLNGLSGLSGAVTLMQNAPNDTISMLTTLADDVVVRFGVGTLPIPNNGDCRAAGEVTMIGEYNQTITIFESAQSLTLFGPETIVGRGLVVIATGRDRTVTCANIPFPTDTTIHRAAIGTHCAVSDTSCVRGWVDILSGGIEDEELIVTAQLGFEQPTAEAASMAWGIYDGTASRGCSSNGDMVLDLSTLSPAMVNTAANNNYNFRQRVVVMRSDLGRDIDDTLSLVLGSEDTSIFACGQFALWTPPTPRARTVTVSIFSNEPAYATIIDEGVENGMVTFIPSFSGLADESGSEDFTITVHKLPLKGSDCSTTGTPLFHGNDMITASFNGATTTTQLPGTLFGIDTMMGRSMVIQAGTETYCGNIGFHGKVIAQQADFGNADIAQGDVRGTITLMQAYVPGEEIRAHGQFSETLVVLDLYTTANASQGHNWHVHKFAVDPNEDNACIATGGHFDPFFVCNWLPGCEAPYAQLCTPETPALCEIGDQSKKLEKLDLPLVSGRERRVYVDVQLPLFGSYSAAGRSLVIHEADGGPARIACADLKDITPQDLSATVDFGAFSGTITQTDDHFVTLSVEDFPQQGNTISTITVNQFAAINSDDCGTQAGPVLRPGGGFFYPFDVVEDGEPPELGASFTVSTNTMSLYGGLTVIGRSVVISTEGGTTFCGTITPSADFASYSASFDEGACASVDGSCAMGTITATPLSASSTEAVIVSDLYVTEPEGSDLDMHAWSGLDGENNVFDPAEACEGDQCDETYSTSCHAGAQLRCRAGDFAQKHGQLLLRSEAQRVQRVFVDEYLPFSTISGVALASIDTAVNQNGDSVTSAVQPPPGGPTTATPNANGTTTTTTQGSDTTTGTTTTGTGTTTTGTGTTTTGTTTTQGGGDTTTTGTTTATATATTTDDDDGRRESSSGLSTAEKAGLGIGITIIVVIILAVVFFSQKRRGGFPSPGAVRIDNQTFDDEEVFALHPDSSA